MITINLKQVTIACLVILYIFVSFSVYDISKQDKIEDFQFLLLMAWIIATITLILSITVVVMQIFMGDIKKEWRINLPKFTRNNEKDELMEAYGKSLMSGNKANAERIFKELTDKNYL